MATTSYQDVSFIASCRFSSHALGRISGVTAFKSVTFKPFSSSFSFPLSSEEEFFLFISLFIMGDGFFCIFDVFFISRVLKSSAFPLAFREILTCRFVMRLFFIFHVVKCFPIIVYCFRMEVHFLIQIKESVIV